MADATTAPTATATRVCSGAGCGKPAKMQCPTCLKNSIAGDKTFFCDQDCFKRNWAAHKLVHPAAPLNNPWPGFEFRGPLRPYPQTPMRTVPSHIPPPDYSVSGIPESERREPQSSIATPLSPERIAKMRVACRLTREVLDIAVAAVRPGVTTDEIDRIVHEATVARNAYPSPLNYRNFPKSCCTSVNEIICHGIPDLRPLQEGDIINIDVSVYYDGFHGDLNETVFVGKVDAASETLVRNSWECLENAIAMVKPGVAFRDLGNVISKTAHAANHSVVRTYVGHGINELFHTNAPVIPHYAKNKAPGVMKAGHVFTIEPMINAGSWQDVTWGDEWTSSTVDGKRSAQFEHTLLVTETGVEVLTARPHTTKPHFYDQLEAQKAEAAAKA
ncbi:methionyl aminopeptidase 1 [Capsaspora owczarzaki ATCC 30864]|uniref:Methionine aminopeptidase n=1 Tax=Capsaspora owczarzaki (strain ATCC 30864) TaxID=595528 RepID=A0A0D2VH52_CAPO3|nr:methionyl aminopeptidase 1 [Capsaspora owczarzaki ATCC 30864]KJE89262.1 methionyl aminopeptidase 1 [Capsaspora owczarzaki ATCC 30864]|eukprot:XP_004365643.1 methionyl aminopeptidase 1 [Capsaspora owczarzaki ATCC 30864]